MRSISIYSWGTSAPFTNVEPDYPRPLVRFAECYVRMRAKYSTPWLTMKDVPKVNQCLVFVDLETSGLDQNAPNAEILELALVAVDPRTLTEVAHWSSPLNARCHTGEWHPRVLDMHQANGLLDDLRGPRRHLRFEAGGWPWVHEAEAVACAFMAQYAPSTEAGPYSPMCGANVGSFDRQWIRKFMPKLDQCFHYRCLDTNTAFLVDQYVFGLSNGVKAQCAHRALADARASVDTLRGMARVLYAGYAAEGRL